MFGSILIVLCALAFSAVCLLVYGAYRKANNGYDIFGSPESSFEKLTDTEQEPKE